MRFNNNDITGIYYSGHTIVRAYGCDGNLVFGEEPYAPTYNFKVHADYNWDIPSEEVPCNSSLTLTRAEVVSMTNVQVDYNDRRADVIIGDCVDIISGNAFNNLNQISSVTIGKNVETIERYALSNLTRLDSITIPSKVSTLGVRSFYGDLSASTLTFMGNSITEIPQECFYQLNIKDLTLPSNVETIGTGAFQHCHSLSGVSLSDNLITISDYAFANCNISSITIPSGVTYIGSSAFTSPLTSVTMTSSVPPRVTNTSFPFNRNVLPYTLAIYVPSDAVNTYKNATGWSYYKDVIQAIQ